MKRCQSCTHTFDQLSWQCPVCAHYPTEIEGTLSFAPDLAYGGEGFPPEAFDALVKSEVGSFWFRSRNELITWALDKYFPQADSFLEIGCGTGFVLHAIMQHNPRLKAAGSELFITGLKYAEQRLQGIQLLQMDARKMPFDSEFSVIGAFDVLEHIKEDREVLSQMYRTVQPEGGIIITVPQHPFLWSSTDDYSHHERRYTSKELKTKVEEAGFTVIRCSSFVSLLMPIMLMARLRPRPIVDQSNAAAELNLNPAVDRLFEKLMQLERVGIQHNFNYPMGGSLLLVGKKSSR